MRRVAIRAAKSAASARSESDASRSPASAAAYCVASSSAANVLQSEELQIPQSVARADVEPALSITISASEISVEGKQALSLRNGQVDPSQKQGGSNGFLVTPLLTVLQQHRDRLKLIAQSQQKGAFRGEVQIIADKRTPYRTLVEVLYTMGQAEFKAMRFVLLKSGQIAKK